MKQYNRVMLGQKSVHAEMCFKGSFIGVDFGIPHDLTKKLPDQWRDFNREFIPVYLKNHPGKTKIGAGLACGNLWTLAKGFDIGSVVLCPDGAGSYRVGEVTGPYHYMPDSALPHQRPVRWLNVSIKRSDMSEDLRNSTGSIGTLCDIAYYHDEIDKLIGGVATPVLIATDKTVEDPSSFAMEKHLEEFLVQNWSHTDLGKDYEIYKEGDSFGQQFPTDTGPIDILAISKNKKRLLVVELKKGRASDVVVGQTLRYMGFVQDELAEENQTVLGVIIALEDDQRIRRALMVVPSISFYRYQVSFKLVKG